MAISNNCARILPRRLTLICFMAIMVFWSASWPTSIAAQPTATKYSYVHGVAKDEEGLYLSNADVYVYTASGALVVTTSTGPYGYFRFTVEFGTYSIQFTRPGYVKTVKSVAVQESYTDLGTIVLPKAVKLSASTLSLVTSPGNRILIPFVASNAGDDAEVLEFVTSGPENWSTKVMDQTGNQITKARISAGQSLTLQLEAKVPLTATANMEYNMSITSIGRTNSSLNFAITVQPSTETVLSCRFPGKSGAPGGTFSFQVRVTNPADLEQRYSLSINAIPVGWIASIESTTGESVTTVTLGGGESVDLVVDVSTPPSASDGKYNLILAANSSSMSEELQLLLTLQRAAADIELAATPPYIDVYAGSQARFKLTASNMGGYDELLNLTAEPVSQDFRVWFEDAAKQQITKLYVEVGQSKDFYVVVAVPSGADLGTQSFAVSVASDTVRESVNLSLNVLGLYQVTVTNTNFYTSLNVGGQGTFTLTVRNDGTEDVTNVQAAVSSATVPDGFTVTLEPASVYSLPPGGEAAFLITVQTQATVNAGNYYIDFTVWSGQTQAQSYTLRVEVIQQTSWMIYGGILIVAAVVGLFLIYRRFGRR